MPRMRPPHLQYPPPTGPFLRPQQKDGAALRGRAVIRTTETLHSPPALPPTPSPRPGPGRAPTRHDSGKPAAAPRGPQSAAGRGEGRRRGEKDRGGGRRAPRPARPGPTRSPHHGALQNHLCSFPSEPPHGPLNKEPADWLRAAPQWPPPVLEREARGARREL